MRRLLAVLALTTATASAQSAPTLQQILSAPYALSLTAAPVGNHFAWVENAEGRRNIWIGAKDEPARQITHYTEDDGQDIDSLTWSPDATSIAYVYGAENGASGKPANPAHLQHPTPLEILIQPIAGGDPIKLTEGHSPLFTRDGKSILFIRSGQIWSARIPPARPVANTSATPSDQDALLGSVLSIITSAPIPDTSKQLIIDRGSASNLTLSPDGKLLAYVSHREHTLIGLYNFDTKELRLLSTSTANDSAPVFSPDSKQIAWLRATSTKVSEFATNRISPEPWSIQLADVATGATRTIFTAEPNKPGSVLPHLSTGAPHLYFAVGNRILFFSEADGWVHLYSIDTSTKTAPVLLSVGDGEVEDVSLSADRKEVFLASNIGIASGYSGLAACRGPVMLLQLADIERRHISSIDVTKPPSLTTNPVVNMFMPNFARKTSGQGIETHPVPLADGSLIALASDSFVPMHPVYVAKDGSLTDVRKQWLPKTYHREALVFPEEVSFPFSDGHLAGSANSSTQIFLPGNTKAGGSDPYPWCYEHKSGPPKKNPERHPAIIFVHGGPDRQMLLGYPPIDYYSKMYAMNQYLALHGYIVLSVNYRCGIGYGLNFRQCEHSGPGGAAEYADVLAAAAYLRSRADVDTAHIGIWGGSYGGYLTALALARNSDIFSAGVDFHGIAEWSLENNAKSDWLYGPDVEKIAATAHASSPMADIAKWRSPVLLIAGDDDPDVAYVQTTTLAAALRARNAHVEELIFPDEVHDFLLHKDWLAAFQATADFFDRTLKPAGKLIPNPVK